MVGHFSSLVSLMAKKHRRMMALFSEFKILNKPASNQGEV
jgi:hypothetical protein